MSHDATNGPVITDTAQDIPPSIYQSLYIIALQDFDTEKIADWYATVLRHVRQTAEENILKAYTRRPSIHATPPPRPPRVPVKTFALAVRDPDEQLDPTEDGSIAELARAARESAQSSRHNTLTPNPSNNIFTWSLSVPASTPLQCPTPAWNDGPISTLSTTQAFTPVLPDDNTLIPPTSVSPYFTSPETPATASELWFRSGYPETSSFSCTTAPSFDYVFLPQETPPQYPLYTPSQTPLTSQPQQPPLIFTPPSTQHPPKKDNHQRTTSLPSIPPATRTPPPPQVSGYREIRPASQLHYPTSLGSPRKRQRDGSINCDTLQRPLKK